MEIGNTVVEIRYNKILVNCNIGQLLDTCKQSNYIQIKHSIKSLMFSVYLLFQTLKKYELNTQNYKFQATQLNHLSALALKVPITNKLFAFDVCCNDLEALWSDSVDPDQTAALGAV